MYVYVHVCMYVCMYVCTCIHMHAHKHKSSKTLSRTAASTNTRYTYLPAYLHIVPYFIEQALGMFFQNTMKLHCEQARGFHDEYLTIKDGRIFVLPTFKKHSHASNRQIDSRLVAYHLRLGKQAGNAKAMQTSPNFVPEFHELVQKTSHLLPEA
jgi:hypothetical protein